jgi:2-amino-4-hydroxy-6-hydroxymethyldihydropteridine diphosphokinase
MSSINPLFPDQVIGGSTKHLQKMAIHLGELGHEVTILSTQRADSREAFRWHENVLIKPVMQFKQPFPQPYEIPAFKMAQNVQTVFDHLARADRFYVHDGEWLFPDSHTVVPTIVSLRDNAYPETMLGMFLFRGDALIPISGYSERVIRATAGRFYPDLVNRLRTVPNAIDWTAFRPKQADPAIFDYIQIDPSQHTILLHPHRPERSKGLRDTIRVADRLVHGYGVTDLLVLVPDWFDADVSPDVREFLEEMRQEISQRGLTEHFYFHPWLPQRLMPDYFNLGQVMLSLGHFVEAFGNTVYEALGCGTPAIAARIATHRDLMPDYLLDKVHFGDVDGAAAIAHRIIRNQERTSPEAMAYLHQHYSVEQQMAGYAEAILTATKQPPLQFRPAPLTPESRFELPPWCYVWEDQIYHDFDARHTAQPHLADLLSEFPGGFTQAQAEAHGVAGQQVDAWYRDGFIVPKGGESTMPDRANPQGEGKRAHRYLIGIGSNIDPASNVARGLIALGELGSNLIASRVVETEPVGMVSQHDFHNLVVYLETDLDPVALKERFNQIETAFGRDRSDPLSPVKDRPLDLDILAEVTLTTQWAGIMQEVDSYYRPLVEELREQIS